MAVPIRERILDAAQRLVLDQGFASTTVDAVLAEAAASKGAFFHHFPSKIELGRALVRRYAVSDLQILKSFMARAEAEHGDPALQLMAFIRAFEEAADAPPTEQPGCLFVSFIYENRLADPEIQRMVAENVLHWRGRILEKLEGAARDRSMPDIDLPSLADQVFTTFEGAFLLARALDDATRVRAQLAHLRHYLELLFGLPVQA